MARLLNGSSFGVRQRRHRDGSLRIYLGMLGEAANGKNLLRSSNSIHNVIYV